MDFFQNINKYQLYIIEKLVILYSQKKNFKRYIKKFFTFIYLSIFSNYLILFIFFESIK